MSLPERLPAWPRGDQWMRTGWVSAAAQSRWTPRIAKIKAALSRVELESVYVGDRSSAMVFYSPPNLPELTLDALDHDCSTLVLGVQGDGPASYSSQSQDYTPGRPFKYRVVVTRDVKPWKVWAAGDEMAIGRLLGYPACCSAFYRKHWVEGGWRDTTLPMVSEGADYREGGPHGNILLRWVGMRFVRHLPCSFGCEETDRVGRQTEALARKLGFNDEMDWLLDMLSWPISWSSLHGIAEITTPVFKISTSSDPLAKTARVERPGTQYPDDGATGLRFPFRQPTKRAVTESRSFIAATSSESPWKQNGFTSAEAQEQAHRVVAETARHAVGESGVVLDLGCGNGALLQRITKQLPLVYPVGIDTEAPRIRSAIQRIIPGDFTVGDIFDISLWRGQYDVVLLMPGRLQEGGDLKARTLRKHLSEHARKVVVYAYGDWLLDGGLVGLCARVGLEVDRDTLVESEHAHVSILRRLL